jgi:hypothetical protein
MNEVRDLVEILRPPVLVPMPIEERALRLERRVSELELYLYCILGGLLIVFLLIRLR